MKVAVVGNCQARPVADYLASMCRDVELLPDTIVHLSGPHTAEEDLKRLDEADLLVAQSVHDGYHAEHLTTNALRKRYPSRVIVWPNLFFIGNCADIAYLTTADNQRLLGPLGAYHNRFVFECWKNGVEEKSALDAVNELYEIHSSRLSDSVETSLSELQRRDDNSDVGIVEFIATQWQNKRLFFTFNHPTAELLIELSRQIADAASIARQLDIESTFDNEPLNPIVPATREQVSKALGLGYRPNSTSKGVVMTYEDDVLNASGTSLYSFAELIKCSYTAYNFQPAANQAVRVTPSYAAA